MSSEKENKYNENDFELEEVKRFDANFAVVRDIGQVIMYIIVICGLAGVFGYGTWTKKAVAINPEATLEYEYFLHNKKETPLIIYLHDNVKRDILVSIQNDYFKKIDIRQVSPDPESIQMVNDKLVFRFNNKKTSSGIIKFTTEAQQSGSVELKLTVNKDPVTVKQFIYP